MIATHNQQNPKDLTLGLAPETTSSLENDTAVSKIMLLPSRSITHNPNAGLNLLVDTAGYLFSVLGKLKQLTSYRQLSKLQNELIQEINTFQDTIKNQHYHAETALICRYVLCATFDDIIASTPWGGQNQWDNYSLLAAFNLDTQHQDKFFTIMERAIKEPASYIDLMEFMYICLSMGYKGQYRSTEFSHYQLEQITNNLYKHIRAYRGSITKTLSPTPLIATKPTSPTTTRSKQPSLLFIFFVTACIIMAIFISLGYLMDVISNEAYQNIAQIKKSVSHETAPS
jgi:type VI secretion system protein ImpK